MKRCPECGRDYNDDSLSFCLDDGMELLFGPAESMRPTADSTPEESATAILHETNPASEAMTRAQMHTTDTPVARSSDDASGAARPFDRRLLLAPVALAIIVLAGFAGYRYLSTTGSERISSIAVMPFVNASGNADIEYLSDGMTESLMNSLSQLPNLSVKARSSVFRYKGKEIEPVVVARELGVQAVLNGRVVQRGDQLTLSLDLVEARTGDQIWGEQYNRKLGDLAAFQSEIARDVSQKLRQRLTGDQERSVTKNHTHNSEAYQLYLQGRYHWNKRSNESTKKAISYFQQTIEKDPTYALAYVGLAESYLVSDITLRESRPKAVAAAHKALEIDPTLGEPHAALANAKWTLELDYAGSEREFRRAIELTPNYATSHHWLAEFLILQGRSDEGFVEYQKALELDPLSLAISTDLGRAYYFTRQYDRAIEYFKKLIEMDPDYVRTHFYLGKVYKEKGMCKEALEEFEKGIVLSGDQVDEAWKKGGRAIVDACNAAGSRGASQKELELVTESLRKGEPVNPEQMAEISARVGDRDKAFEWLEKVFDQGMAGAIELKVSPDWDNLRDDPRFADVLRRAGWPDSK